MEPDKRVNVEELNEKLRNNIPGLTYNGKPITAKLENDEEESNDNRIKILPETVELDGYKIKIYEDSTVILVDEIDRITADDLTENYYGAYVNYKIDTNGDTTKDWRIFYVKNYDGEGGNVQVRFASFDNSDLLYFLHTSENKYNVKLVKSSKVTDNKKMLNVMNL